jgi:hypothetical protein
VAFLSQPIPHRHDRKWFVDYGFFRFGPCESILDEGFDVVLGRKWFQGV